MRVQYFENFSGMSECAAEIVMETLVHQPQALFCAATGHSPSQLYQILSDEHLNKRLFKNASFVQLDEWLGLPSGSPGTCQHYLEQHLYGPLLIPESRRIAFRSDVLDPEEECARIENEVAQKGPIDLCILGLGKNGHVGLNEPAETLSKLSHTVGLSELSKAHAMISDVSTKPTQGMTLGMGAIMNAKRILLLVAGDGKRDALDAVLSGKVSSRFPASFLQLHRNVDCLICI